MPALRAMSDKLNKMQLTYIFQIILKNLTVKVFIHYLHKKHGLAEVQNT